MRFAWPGLPSRTHAAGVLIAILVIGIAVTAWADLAPGQGSAVPAVLPAWFLVVELVTAAVVAAAAVAVDRWHALIGLTLVLAAALLPTWAAWPIVPTDLLPVLPAAAPLAVVGVALVADVERAGAVGVPALAAGLVLAFGYDPFADPACWETCEQARPLLGRWVSTHTAVTAAGCAVVVAAGLAAVQLVRRRAGAAPRVRGAAAVSLAILVTAWVLRLVGWAGATGWVTDPATGLLPEPVAERLLVMAAGVLVSIVVLVTEAGRRRTLRAVRRLAERLAAPEAALAGSAAGVTGVDFAVPGSSGWVDAAGRPVPELADACLILSDGPDPVARVHLSARADSDAVLAVLTPSARLALRNAQLLAAGRAQLAQVQASRRRIVGTSDAERRRIERDLHDGAQQRLVSAALHLQIARSRVPAPVAVGLGAAEEQLRGALARLRRLAHGVFPAALAEDGLSTALEELAAGTDVALSFEVDAGLGADLAELDPDVALAAYATVADAVAAASPSAKGAVDVAVRVEVRRLGEDLMVAVIVPAVSAGDVEQALVDATDRVGALGGTLTVCQDGTGSRVKAVIPCVSSSPTT